MFFIAEAIGTDLPNPVAEEAAREQRFALEKCTAFCTADLPTCAISAFFENLLRRASKIHSSCFSSIYGKIDSIGEVAEFSGVVRVLPEEPICFCTSPLKS